MDAVGMKEGVGKLQPQLRVLPGRAELVVVKIGVLIVAVKGDVVGAAGSADRRFKSRVAGNYVIGENAAVAPSSDSEPIRIGDALGPGIMYRRQNVVDLPVPPVGENALAVLRAASGTPAVVDIQDYVSGGGKQLPFEGKGMCVLA